MCKKTLIKVAAIIVFSASCNQTWGGPKYIQLQPIDAEKGTAVPGAWIYTARQEISNQTFDSNGYGLGTTLRQIPQYTTERNNISYLRLGSGSNATRRNLSSPTTDSDSVTDSDLGAALTPILRVDNTAGYNSFVEQRLNDFLELESDFNATRQNLSSPISDSESASGSYFGTAPTPILPVDNATEYNNMSFPGLELAHFLDLEADLDVAGQNLSSPITDPMNVSSYDSWDEEIIFIKDEDGTDTHSHSADSDFSFGNSSSIYSDAGYQGDDDSIDSGIEKEAAERKNAKRSNLEYTPDELLIKTATESAEKLMEEAEMEVEEREREEGHSVRYIPDSDSVDDDSEIDELEVKATMEELTREAKEEEAEAEEKVPTVIRALPEALEEQRAAREEEQPLENAPAEIAPEEPIAERQLPEALEEQRAAREEEQPLENAPAEIAPEEPIAAIQPPEDVPVEIAPEEPIAEGQPPENAPAEIAPELAIAARQRPEALEQELVAEEAAEEGELFENDPQGRSSAILSLTDGSGKNNAPPANTSFAKKSLKTRGPVTSAYFGYYLTDNLAAEFGISADLAHKKNINNVDYNLSYSGFSATVGARYAIPNNTKFTPFVVAGVGVANARFHLKGGSDDVKANKTGFTYYAGLGLSYQLAENIALEGKYKYTGYGFKAAKVNATDYSYKFAPKSGHSFLLGVNYKF